MKKKLPVKKAKVVTKKAVAKKVVAKKVVVKKGFLKYQDGGPVVKGRDNTGDFIYLVKDATGKSVEVDYKTYGANPGKKTRLKKDVDGNAVSPGTGGAVFRDYVKMKKGGTKK